VFLGIAMSTFLFVAAFFRSGVVKYVANGINIRSTIERSPKTAKWLDQNGDQIQVLVLQNYLFFGNASSILTYISSMFEEPSDEVDSSCVPPLPKIVVLDMTLVTGMDTSSVDVILDILALFSNHDSKLFLSGVSTHLRQVMLLGGVKPESIRDRSNRKLRFFPDLDSAIGKAEDMLLEKEAIEEENHHASAGDNGFQRALRHIDEQVRRIDCARSPLFDNRLLTGSYFRSMIRSSRRIFWSCKSI
jgi:SulP family sulfate permease